MSVEEYRLINGKFGNRFMRNNRFIKVADVPADIKAKLESTEAAVQADPHTCIFCGGHASETRFIQLQTIALCAEDYYGKTVGQVVQRLKEVYHEQVA